MDPTVALWILGSITVGFITLLPMVFIILTLLIPRFAREYLTKEEFIADIGMAAFKVLSKKRARKKDRVAHKEIGKILMETRIGGLLIGTYMGFIFFLGSIGLVAYCLIIMGFVEMGSDFPSIFVVIATSWAVALLVILFHRIGRSLHDVMFKEFERTLEKFMESKKRTK